MTSDAELIAERLLVPTPARYGVGPLDISRGVDWAAHNSSPVSFQWWINTLAFVERFVGVPGDTERLDIAVRLVKEWCDANPLNAPAALRAWDGHAAALRAKVLCDLHRLAPALEWLDRSIEQHGAFLANAEHYQGAWNHGLDQDIGLIHVADAIGRADWLALGLERAVSAIELMVDAQGLTREQSINYQKYNHYQIKRYLPLLRAKGADIADELVRRHAAMPLVLAHATCPDGTYEVLGDTSRQLAEKVDGAEADFAASRGGAGLLPSATCQVFEGGFVFGRSGWGVHRPFTDETFYSVRFGPGRLFHGHHDHMSITWRPRGHRLLIDSGINAYTEERWKEYFRSPRAHNVVLAEGERFLGRAVTNLVNQNIEPGVQYFELQDRPHPGVKRSRRLLFVDAADVVVVVDNLVAHEARTFAQHWHLAPGSEVSITGGTVDIEGQPIRARMHQLLPHDSISTVAGQLDPIQGWAAEGLYERVPSRVVTTRSHGEQVAFITVFVAGDGAAVSCAEFTRHRGGEARGRLTVARPGSAAIHVDFMRDGVLRLQP